MRTIEMSKQKLYVSRYKLQSKEPNSKDLPYLEEIEFCKKWINDNCTKTKTIRTRHTSYGLKHMVEKDSELEWCGPYFYVSNGAFIQAAIELGFVYRPVGVNAVFNISLKDNSHEGNKRVKNTSWK
jgi:hypothetical protein